MDEQRRYWMDEYGVVWGNDGAGGPGATEVLPVVVGSREWAVLMAMRGKNVMPEGKHRAWAASLIASSPGEEHTRWVLCPPPWVPTRGEHVRWYRDEDSGTGTYAAPWTNLDAHPGHHVYIAGVQFWVERVERLPPGVTP